MEENKFFPFFSWWKWIFNLMDLNVAFPRAHFRFEECGWRKFKVFVYCTRTGVFSSASDRQVGFAYFDDMCQGLYDKFDNKIDDGRFLNDFLCCLIRFFKFGKIDKIEKTFD